MNEFQAVIPEEVPKWKDKFAIVGIGDTDYTRNSGVSEWHLAFEAMLRAVDDAGLRPKDIDGMIEGGRGRGASNEEVQEAFGLDHLKFFSRGMGGGTAVIQGLQTALAALDSGLINYAIISTARNGSSETRVSATGSAPPWAASYGGSVGGGFAYLHMNWYDPWGASSVAPWYSFICRRYMHEYGLTKRQLGALPVAWRKHAQLNPKAMYRGRPLTIEDYLNAPILVDPFCRWDFSLESDGGGAFIVTTAKRARDLKQAPIYVMGVGVAHPSSPTNLFTRKELAWGHKWAAPIAYKMAGVTPRDIDFAELYDGFSFHGLVQLPSLGFCKPEECGEWCQGGRIELGGELPTNTHGGCCSEAHNVGMNHVIEAVRQLRGVRADGQVKKKNGSICEIGIVTGAGDLGDGAVTILRR